MEAGFQLIFHDDYKADYPAAEALISYLREIKAYPTETIDKAVKAAEVLFQRLGEDREKDKLVWSLVETLGQKISYEKQAVQDRLLKLFIGSTPFLNEIKKIKRALIEEEKPSPDLRIEILVAKIAFDKLSELSLDLQRDLSCVQKTIPVAVSMEGEAKRLAEAILPLVKTSSPRVPSLPVAIPKSLPKPVFGFFSRDSKIPLSESLFFLVEPAPGSSPGEDIRQSKLERLTELADQLFSEYSQGLFSKVSPEDRRALLDEVRLHLPALVEKLFISEPHNLKPYEKDAVLAALQHAGKFLADLEMSKKGAMNKGKEELLRLMALRLGFDIKDLRSHMIALLKQIISCQIGTSGGTYQPVTSPLENATKACTAGFLFVAIDRVLIPENVILFVKRVLEEEIDFKSVAEKLPKFTNFDGSDTQFSYSAGENMEFLIRKLGAILMGESKLLNGLLKFFKRDHAGKELQQRINMVLSSEVSMAPLVLLSHILLFEEGGAKRGVLLDKRLPEDYNLRSELKSKIKPLIEQNGWIAKTLISNNAFKINDSLETLADLIATFLETKEGLYILVTYLLRGYLKFVSDKSGC